MKVKHVAVSILALIIGYNLMGAGPRESSIRSRVVRLVGTQGMCSGEQIKAPSGKDYILSAAHCRIFEKDGSIEIHTEDGKILQSKFLAEDKASDLMLLEGLPGVSGLEIAQSTHRNQHIRTFTHGKDLDTYKTEGEVIQKEHIEVLLSIITTDEEAANCSGAKFQIKDFQSFFGLLKACVLSVDETITTASIVPGSSGGVAVDDSGKVIGVASVTDGHFGYFVTIRDINNFLSAY